MKKTKTKIKDNIKLFVGNFVTNVKGKIKGDGIKHLKKFHSQSREVATCKEYQL